MIDNQHAEDLRRCCAALETENKRLREALAEIVAAADGDGWSQLDPSFEKARAALSGESKC
jgi:hypothetical protein